MLKISRVLILVLLIVTIKSTVSAQITPIKKFSPDMLEGKTLYIPQFAPKDKFVKRMMRRGRGEKAKDAQQQADYYNKAWREALAESSYDATPYSTEGYTLKELRKSKQSDKMVIFFFTDKYDNESASIWAMISKKWRPIANAPITGLSIHNKEGLKLIMNMLNESLTQAIELSDGKKVKRRDAMSKYKKEVVEFYDGMADKTFLISDYKHKNPKKAAKRNKAIKEALRSWSLSKVKFTTDRDISEKRLAKDKNSFYLLVVPYYTNSPLITYYFNMIVSTENDDILFVNLQMKKLKGSTFTKMEENLKKKVEKYRAQLSDQ